MTSEIRSGRFTVIEDEEAVVPSRFTVIDEEVIEEPPSRFTVIDEEDINQNESPNSQSNEPDMDIPEQPMYAPVDSSSSSGEPATIGPYSAQAGDTVYTLSDAQAQMQYHDSNNEANVQSNFSPSGMSDQPLNQYQSSSSINDQPSPDAFETSPPLPRRSGRFTVIDEEGEQTVLLTSGHVDSSVPVQSFSPSSELESVPSMQRTHSQHDPNMYPYQQQQQQQIPNDSYQNQQGYGDPEMVGAADHHNYGQQNVDPEHIQHYTQQQNYDQQQQMQDNYQQQYDYQQQQQQPQQVDYQQQQYVQQDQYVESQDAGHSSPSLQNEAAAYGPINLLSMLNCQVYGIVQENEQLRMENQRLMAENEEIRAAYNALFQQLQSGVNHQQYIQPAEIQTHQDQDHGMMQNVVQYPSPASSQSEDTSFVTLPANLSVSNSSSKRPPTIQVPSLDSNGSERHDQLHQYASGTATTETPSSTSSHVGSPQPSDSFPTSAAHSPVSVTSKTDSTLSVISTSSSAQSSDSGKSAIRKPVCKPPTSTSSAPSIKPAPLQAAAVSKPKPAASAPAKKKCTLTNPGDFFADFGQSKLLADLTANPLGPCGSAALKPSTACNDAMSALAASLGLKPKPDSRPDVVPAPMQQQDPSLRCVQNSSFDDLKGLALGASPCPSPTFGVLAGLRNKKDSSIFL